MKIGDLYYSPNLGSIVRITDIAERGFGVLLLIVDHGGIMARWVDRRSLEVVNESR